LTNAHIESLKQNCIAHVEYHQPIPPAVIQSATEPLPAEWFNDTETNSVTEESSTTAPPAPSSTEPEPELNFFTEALLRNLKEIGCKFDCRGNGVCHYG